MRALFLTVLVGGITAFCVGCSTDRPSSIVEPVSDEPVVMCARCQTVWVSSPHHVGKATVFRREEKMVCPDCDSAVVTFFKAGKFEHTCKTCGDGLAACPKCK